jgi:hypothetical protein
MAPVEGSDLPKHQELNLRKFLRRLKQTPQCSYQAFDKWLEMSNIGAVLHKIL